MAHTSLNPQSFFEYDTRSGAMRTRDGGRVVVVSDEVLGSLVGAAVAAGDLRPIRRLGENLARQIESQQPITERSPEQAVDSIAGVTASFGWGRFELERLGDALVLVGKDLPSTDDGRFGIAALLGGLFSKLAQRQVACVPIGTERFMIVDHKIAETVWNWAQEGLGAHDIVSRLTVEAE